MFSLLKGLLEFLSPLEKENHSLILSVLVCSMIQYSKSLIKKKSYTTMYRKNLVAMSEIMY